MTSSGLCFLFPNLGVLYGLSDIAGYDGVTPRHIEQLMDAADSVGLAVMAALDSPPT